MKGANFQTLPLTGTLKSVYCLTSLKSARKSLGIFTETPIFKILFCMELKKDEREGLQLLSQRYLEKNPNFHQACIQI